MIRRLRHALAGLAVLAASVAVPAQQGTTTTVTIERGERLIVVEQRALATEGARSILGAGNCEEATGVTLFYGPPPGFVLTLVDETRLTSTVALVRVPDDDGDETLELFGGTATIERGCLVGVAEGDAERVVLEQGRTTVTGTRFFLDQGTDVAEMNGPVMLERRNEAGALALEASSSSLTFDVATERATLIGDVVVTSDERVSTAERLELDEAAGVALLTGSPAVSRRNGDEVRGATLRYDLETDDVIVTGGIEATFEIDLD